MNKKILSKLELIKMVKRIREKKNNFITQAQFIF